MHRIPFCNTSAVSRRGGVGGDRIYGFILFYILFTNSASASGNIKKPELIFSTSISINTQRAQFKSPLPYKCWVGSDCNVWKTGGTIKGVRRTGTPRKPAVICIIYLREPILYIALFTSQSQLKFSLGELSPILKEWSS